MKSSAILAFLLVAVLVVVALAAISATIQNTGNMDSPLKVTVDGVDYTNGTVLEWGNMTWGTNYSKNMTVQNVANQNLTTYLTTNEPEGTKHSWNGNNTLLVPNQNVTYPLWLNITAPQPDTYNWTITVHAIGD